jgi:translocation and assembly module TamB
MRRALRIAAWSLTGVLLLAVLLVGAVLVLANTPSGRALIERQTALITSGSVRISGLAGTFPSAIDVGRLELSDTQGVWMSAERIVLRWSPLALFRWELHVQRFEIGRAAVMRRPVSKSAQASRMRLPVVDIDRLAIGTLELEPAVVGMAARLDVEGSAHYKSMENLRANLVARRTNGTGTYAVRLLIDASQINASLELEEPPGGPLEHLANVPELGALAVTASLEGPRNALRLRLLARAGELRADANGTVDLKGRSADLDYSVNSPAMMPGPGLGWTHIALKGRWRGPLAAPQATAVLDLQGLELPDGAQLAKLNADLAANGRLLTVRATADGITLPGSGPQLLRDSPLSVNATLRLDAADRPLQLSVRHRVIDLEARAVTAGARSATFDLRLPDVAPFAALYEQDIRGSMSLTGNVTESTAATRLEVNGTGDLTGASLAAGLLGASTRLHLAGALTTRTVDIQSLELNGRALSMSASGTADRTSSGAASSSSANASSSAVGAVRAAWRVSLPDLSVVSRSVTGSLQVTGTANGTLQSLAADVQARSTVAIQGSPPGTVDATLKARGLPSTPSAALLASGTFDGAPLRLDAFIERIRGNAYRIVVHHSAWKSLAINGDLTAGSNLAMGRGNLRFTLGQLGDLQNLVGMSLAGSIAANVAMTPAAGRTRVHIDVDARDVVAGGIAGSARFFADGPVDALGVQLSAQFPSLGGEPASLSSVARLDEPAHVLDLYRLEAHYHGQTMRLLSQSRVSFAKGLTVHDLRLGAQKAVVSVDGELSPALDLRASIHQVDAALVGALIPNTFAGGTLNADASVKGTRSAPVGRASLEIAGLKLANEAAQGLPGVDMRGSATFRGSTADVSAQLHAGPQSQLTLSGQAPLNAAGTVDLKLAGKVDAALMNSFLEARGERAGGTISIDARVAGTVEAPQIDGTIHLANGDLRDYAEGIHLQDIDARLVGEQGVLKIASMTARAGPGQLSATGTIGVLQSGMPVSIELTAKRIQPITNDILTANLDADMRVAGTLRERLDVTGDLHIHRASISIPNGFPPSVAVLNVVRPGQAQPSPTPSRLVIGLGITLNAPEAIFVQGRGLDAQLGGKLEVAGTSEAPQVNGGFSMIRGTFSIAGANLRFTSGRVTFNGEGLKGRIDPTLDFVAQASVVYTTATIVKLHITGFADSPKIELSSTPPLPQDDLLGLLLFGKPASQLNAFQLAESGAALASLSGIGQGGGGGTISKYNPLNWLKRTLGLNMISVGGASQPGDAATGGGTQTSGASVTAGKYISNRVYVAATQTTLGTSQVEVDIDLSERLKLQTRLSTGATTAQGATPQNDPGSSIGLIYQFQY